MIEDGPLDEVMASDHPTVRAFFDRVGAGGIAVGEDVFDALEGEAGGED